MRPEGFWPNSPSQKRFYLQKNKKNKKSENIGPLLDKFALYCESEKQQPKKPRNHPENKSITATPGFDTRIPAVAVDNPNGSLLVAILHRILHDNENIWYITAIFFLLLLLHDNENIWYITAISYQNPTFIGI